MHWAPRFLRADAEQPVGVMRWFCESFGRINGFFWNGCVSLASRFYPVKKREISPALDSAHVNTTVLQALHLDELSASEVVQN